jgi:hypothetical protein
MAGLDADDVFALIQAQHANGVRYLSYAPVVP